jgi:hypothetical protein
LSDNQVFEKKKYFFRQAEELFRAFCHIFFKELGDFNTLKAFFILLSKFLFYKKTGLFFHVGKFLKNHKIPKNFLENR